MKTKGLILLLVVATVFIFGCGKPNEPESIFNSEGYTIVKKYPTVAAAQDVVINGNLCFIAQGEGGLQTVNVLDHSNPSSLSFITDGVRGYSRSIAYYDNHVYLSAGTFGFTSVNVSNPDTPVLTAANINMKPAKSAFVLDNYMFCAISEQGVQIAELSSSGLPDIKSKTKVPGYANEVIANSDKTLMFVACGEMGLSIFDISDFQEGYGTYPSVGWIDTPDYVWSVAIAEDSKLAFVASGTAGLQIIDYSVISDIKVVGTLVTDGKANKVKYADGLVYMSAEKGGFYVINVDDPANPIAKARLGLTQAMGFDIDSKYIYVADDVDGLVIISKP